MSISAPTPSRLRPRDTMRVAFSGLRARPLRAVLSALGIAVGIAAMVAVVGISASSQEQVNQQLRELGTDLLTVTPGTSFAGEAKLPEGSVEMVDRIEAVNDVSAIGLVDGANVYRNEEIDEKQTNALAVYASHTNLLDTVSAQVASGSWLNSATSGYPAVVLGADAAGLLGINVTVGSVDVWLGGEWFTVVGVLDPAPLAPELDMSAMIGWPVAKEVLGFDGSPTTIYERSDESAVADVADLLPMTGAPLESGRSSGEPSLRRTRGPSGRR